MDFIYICKYNFVTCVYVRVWFQCLSLALLSTSSSWNDLLECVSRWFLKGEYVGGILLECWDIRKSFICLYIQPVLLNIQKICWRRGKEKRAAPDISCPSTEANTCFPVGCKQSASLRQGYYFDTMIRWDKTRTLRNFLQAQTNKVILFITKDKQLPFLVKMSDCWGLFFFFLPNAVLGFL